MICGMLSTDVNLPLIVGYKIPFDLQTLFKAVTEITSENHSERSHIFTIENGWLWSSVIHPGSWSSCVYYMGKWTS